MVKRLEIYNKDLTSRAQARLLREFPTIPGGENWDVFPVAEIKWEIKLADGSESVS